MSKNVLKPRKTSKNTKNPERLRPSSESRCIVKRDVDSKEDFLSEEKGSLQNKVVFSK